MIITKKSLPRRTFLRGMGVSLALPLLDAMVPALSAMAQTAAAPVRRLGVIYVPNGMAMNSWTPASAGADVRPHADPAAARRRSAIGCSCSPVWTVRGIHRARRLTPAASTDS